MGNSRDSEHIFGLPATGSWWFPSEAPRDGAKVLLLCRGGHLCVAGWDKENNAWYAHDGDLIRDEDVIAWAGICCTYEMRANHANPDAD